MAAAAWLFIGVGPAFANALPDWAERPDEDLLVLGLQLDRYTLMDGFIAFYDGKQPFLPLNSLAEALEFPISVDPEKGTADGWFLNDDRTFALDMRSSQVVIEGKAVSINPARIERHPDDIYVALSELETWFPFLLELRFQDLQISVKPLEPFPLQERIAREERRAQLRDTTEEELQQFTPENGWFEWPFVDISLQAGGGNRAEAVGGTVRQTATVAGIVGGLDGEATMVADSEQGAPNFRVRLGRRSLDGGLLGPLNARAFFVGDVATSDLPLIADNTVGRGFEISSFDLDRLEQTNRVTLRGELPAGWQVEIYRNEELIDFQTDQDVGDGRYEFSNVPTLAGLNVFRLAFYGPQGQTRERVERYFVSPQLAEPGKTSFRLAANQANEDLIFLDDEDVDRVDDGEDRFVFQVEHGVGETLSISGGFASYSLEGERRNYLSGGVQTSLFGALVNFDLAVDDMEGVALGGRAQTRLGSWSFSGEQTWFENFHSETTDNGSVGGHLRSRTAVRLNGHIPDYGLGHQPLSASVVHEVSEMGNWQTNVFGRISSIIRPFNFALSTNTRLREQQETESDLRLLVGTLLGDFQLRGDVGFDLLPDAEFAQVNMRADWRIDENFGAGIGLNHLAGDDELTSVTAGVYRQFDAFNLGFNIDANSEGDYSAGLGLSFSFGHNPAADRIEMSATPFARKSAISAKAFLDQNNDGKFGPGEKVIENVGFSGPRMPRDVVTAGDGTAFIVGLKPYSRVEIGLNEATLEDPFWIPAEQPKQVIMRPGTTTQLLFPVIQTGEVDGLVLIQQEPRLSEIEAISHEDDKDILDKPEIADKPGSGMRVLLLDEQETVVAETVSAYDGFFFINKVPYGRYHLKLDPQQTAELGYKPGPSRSFTIEEEEPFAIGQDLFAAPLADFQLASNSPQ